MGVTTTQRIVQLPTSTAAEADSRGQSHHSFFARDTARNANYALKAKTQAIIASGHGCSTDDTTSATLQAQTHFGTMGPISHSMVWWPASHGLTISWAIRAWAKAYPTAGTMNVYVCDQGWNEATPPAGCVYDVSPTATVANTSASVGTGSGIANGEYTGSLTITFPLRKDSMVHVYVKNVNVGFASYVLYADVTP